MTSNGEGSEAVFTRHPMFGRDHDQGAIRSMSSGIVLIVADSGVGKSRLLMALENGWETNDHVTPAAVLGGSAGSLQNAIADSLAEAASSFADRGIVDGSQLWRGFADIVQRATSVTQKQMGRLLVARIFSATEAKFGREVAEDGRQVLADVLAAAGGDGLSDRIHRIPTPDTATEILAVADALSAAADKRLILRFDRGELLHRDDLALLGELSERSISSLMIIVTIGSHHPGAKENVEDLRIRGAQAHDLMPLGEVGMREWLASASVDIKHWKKVASQTNCYPFFVEVALQLLAQGAPLTEIESPSNFLILLQKAWRALSTQARIAATKMAAFVDPPEDTYLTQLLQVSQLEWSNLRTLLRESGVFIVRPDASVWFHERRRSFVWNEVMIAADRREASHLAIVTLEKWLADARWVPEWAVEALPTLLRMIQDSLPVEEWSSKLLDLQENHLAMLLAALELVEPNGTFGKAVDTAKLGTYAQTRGGALQDPIQTLQELEDRGFLHSSANELVSITVPIVPGDLEYASLLGEIQHRLGLRPNPRFGSSVFYGVLRPLLGPIELAIYSIGGGDLRHHRQAVQTIVQSETPRRLVSDVYALGVDIRHDNQTVAATVVLPDRGSKKMAQAALLAYDEGRQHFEPSIENVWDLPPLRIKVGHFKTLKDELVRDAPLSVPSRSLVRQYAALRLSVRESASEWVSPIEASALGISGPSSVLLDIRKDGSSWAELWTTGGASSEVRLFNFPKGLYITTDPLRELRLIKMGVLHSGERISEWTVRSHMTDVPDPFAASMNALAERGEGFNRGLERVKVDLREASLVNELQKQREVLNSLRQEMESLGAKFDAAKSKMGASVHLIAQWQDTGMGFREFFVFSYIVDDDRDLMTFRIVDEGEYVESWFGGKRPNLKRFGIANADLLVASGAGPAASVLGSYLGYTDDDVKLSS